MNYEIIEEVRKCRRVVETLMKEEIISCDAEGINLGKDGPLTLLQIATTDGHVYLFDIHKDKRMFQDGGLKQLLESNHVLKVFHACSGDSEALKHQFGVSLRNVFDTQVAHMVILERQGRLIAPRLKLSEICEIYGMNKMEAKTDMLKKWNKTEPDYWERRPLTTEMIEYACEDVTILVPEIYENQLRKLKSVDAMELFRKRVEETINYKLDPELKKRRSERMDNAAKTVLRDMGRKYRSSASYETLTDEDEKAAIDRNWSNEEIELCMTHVVQNMYYEAFLKVLRELKKEMDQDGDDFNPVYNYYYALCKGKTYSRPNIKELATDLDNRFRQIISNDIVNKYNRETPLYFLRDQERAVIKDIRIKSARDKSKYHSLLVHFYYKLIEEDFKEFEERLAKNPSKVTVTKGFYTFLGYQTKESYIPANVRQAATRLKQAIDRAGKNPFPPRPRRPPRSYDDYDYYDGY
ncbi:ribonuclease D [Patella vulgata]|uniref:ribonuclease D n=1 Tax=Patella vulgata TaxID=6465 RepID=UPI0024A89286|nr:ribonuclease D [Patella vulgata]XP_055958175.1 ribonuclease D [Patella vulgata]XP_055958176.1 ribonuclease D [Patella vulgata]XP_055958177.1 ribonuclease D [Patella vulgata]XP_055958178.1 ribonuclease D [Patella vulgata]